MSALAARLGEAVVELRAPADRLRRDLDGARASTERWGEAAQRENLRAQRSFQQTEGTVATLRRSLVALASVAVLTRFTSNLLADVDAIGKAADRIGVSTAALQEFRYGAELSGVAVGSLENGLQRLTRQVGEAAAGTGEAARTFREMGIEIRDAEGGIRPTEQVLRDVADRIAAVESPAERARLAFQLFGREGAALVALLRDGSAGLDRFSADLHRMGGVMEDSAIRRVERLNDAMTQMRAMLAPWRAAWINTVADVVEALTSLEGAARLLTPRFSHEWLGIAPDAPGAPSRLTLPAPEIEIPTISAGPMSGDAATRERQVELVNAQRAALDDYLASLQDEAFHITLSNRERAKSEAVLRAQNLAMAEGNLLTEAQIATIQGTVDAIEDWREHWARLGREEMDAQRRLRDSTRLYERFGDAVAASLERAALSTRNMSDAVQDLALSIASLVLRQSVTAPLASAISAGIGNIFGGARAAGGPVSAGRLYLVGERGPELFAPGAPGQIVPNSALGGGGGNVQVTVVNQTGVEADARVSRTQTGGVDELVVTLERRMASRLAGQGGDLSRAIENTFGLSRRGR